MHYITAEQINSVLTYPELIEAIRDSFASIVVQPERAHFTIERPGETDATLLLMPAWSDAGYLGVKSATIYPENTRKSIPSVMATYLLMDGSTGVPLVILDGKALTVLRTAATSALASWYLSRQDSSELVIVGAGAMCLPLIHAHRTVRPISSIKIWNRTTEAAGDRVAELSELGIGAAVCTDLEQACKNADIISCATLSREPLIRSDWLAPGVHLDLIGAYTSEMRETDSATVARARVFVDTFEGARAEAGDLIQAESDGLFSFDNVQSDMAGMSAGNHKGRMSDAEITLFKSVGAACEDLAAAVLAYERLS